MSVFIVGLGFYFFILALVGYLSSRRVKTLEDYLIAGRRLPFWLSVATIVATWYGAGSCMGVAGTVYLEGFYGVIADPFGCSLSLMIAGLFFAGSFRRGCYVTISDLLCKAYGPRFEKVATCLMIPLYIGTLAAQMLAMGYVFHIAFDADPMWGILLGTVIIVFYTMAGGMWAVSITDFIQLALMIIGLLLIFPLTWMHLQNPSEVCCEFFRQFASLVPKNPSNFGLMSFLGRVCMTTFGAIMGQDLIQRILSCRSERIARSSVITGGIFYFGLGLIPLFIGLAGRQLFPNLENPEYLIPLIAKQFLSPFGFTLFICGLLSAIMSTADSYLLAGTSLITNNILLKVCEIKDEKKKILFIRLIHILLALAALFLALHGTSIFCMMVHSGATLFVAIFIPATAALLLKKNNRAAAWCSLILGTGTWLLSMTVFQALGSTEDVLFASAAMGGSFSLVGYLAVFFGKLLFSRKIGKREVCS